MSASPQPHCPISALFGSAGQRSIQSCRPSLSPSTSRTPHPQTPEMFLLNPSGTDQRNLESYERGPLSNSTTPHPQTPGERLGVSAEQRSRQSATPSLSLSVSATLPNHTLQHQTLRSICWTLCRNSLPPCRHRDPRLTYRNRIQLLVCLGVPQDVHQNNRAPPSRSESISGLPQPQIPGFFFNRIGAACITAVCYSVSITIDILRSAAARTRRGFLESDGQRSLQ